MPRLTPDDLAHLIDGDDDRRVSRRPVPPRRTRPEEPPSPRPRMRRNERDPFRCGRCRAMVGPTVSGGLHRNHCPFCLTSRHVDLRRPGDRASACRALMAPVGTQFRPDGEQMILHRCNGCGVERRNRVAADDDPVALLRLAPVAADAVSATPDQAADDLAIA